MHAWFLCDLNFGGVWVGVEVGLNLGLIRYVY